ncbi:MAG: hypothetical protein ACOX7J_01000, partial [Bacillota bacterium]
DVILSRNLEVHRQKAGNNFHDKLQFLIDLAPLLNLKVCKQKIYNAHYDKLQFFIDVALSRNFKI